MCEDRNYLAIERLADQSKCSTASETEHMEPTGGKLNPDCPLVEKLGSLVNVINRIATALEECLRINKVWDLSNLAGELKKVSGYSELIAEASEYLASDNKIARTFLYCQRIKGNLGY